MAPGDSGADLMTPFLAHEWANGNRPAAPCPPPTNWPDSYHQRWEEETANDQFRKLWTTLAWLSWIELMPGEPAEITSAVGA